MCPTPCAGDNITILGQRQDRRLHTGLVYFNVDFR